ncbi:MAG: hypothetical protein DYG89_16530 [Caldilinea sp. CFX5]|nr:hypothetical protein [Caldilinea sp. CFX5]
MNNKWNRWVVGGLGALLAVTVAVGAATTTFANDQGVAAIEWRGNHGGPGGLGRGASLTTIATALNMTVADLQSALQSGKTVAALATEKGVALQTIVDALIAEQKTVLQQAVTAGRLTQAQADARLAALQTQLPTQLSTAFTPGLRGGGRGMPGSFGPGASFATIATTLGVSESELMTALQAGKSVADIAAEKNVDLAKVSAAIVAEQKTALQQAVTAGRLTQAQAHQQLARLQANLPHLLSLKGGMGPGLGGPRGHGRFGGDRNQQEAPAPLSTPSQQSNDAPVVPGVEGNA